MTFVSELFVSRWWQAWCRGPARSSKIGVELCLFRRPVRRDEVVKQWWLQTERRVAVAGKDEVSYLEGLSVVEGDLTEADAFISGCLPYPHRLSERTSDVGGRPRECEAARECTGDCENLSLFV